MLRILDLLLRATKYCLILTLIRLLTSAFGYEFGVSRQYLRLLEWILLRGKERIERCESEQRLQQQLHEHPETLVEEEENEARKDMGPCRRSSELMDAPLLPTNLSPNGDLAEREHSTTSKRSSDSIEQNEEPPVSIKMRRERRNGIASIDLDGLSLREACQRLSSNTKSINVTRRSDSEQKNRRRRVSTPDGPPVFLLDDDDEEQSERGLDGVRETGDPSRNHHEGRKHEFHLQDATKFVVRGVEAIIDDEVTKRFTQEQLKTWNLLTRNNARNYQFMSGSLGFWWLTGLIIRYSVLMPLRIMFTLTGFVWLVITMPLVGLLPSWLARAKLHQIVSLMAFRMLSCGINSRLRFHNRQNRARGGSICVANHTSPLDVVLLASDNCYTLVGQRHGGLLGLLQVALSRAANHIWFERGEIRDRQLVATRLKEHVEISSNLPILIFPEGTCINNSAVMMFRKGSFEVTDRIYPVAIKYDPRFGDPFWNSSKQGYVQYLLTIMSAWAIKCDVWYLQPMDRIEGESSAEFANRVKAEIAKQAGLEDLAWDGQLKRLSVKPTWLFQQQEDYARRLKVD